LDPLFSFAPIGLGFALLQNKAAKDYYDSLNDDEKKEYLERTRAYRSEGESDSLLLGGAPRRY